MKNRRLAAIVVGILAFCASIVQDRGPGRVDFMWSVWAARDLVAGHDPYAPPSNIDMIPYPLTAVLAVLPLAWMPVPVATAAFFGLSSALLAFGLLREGQLWKLMVFGSAPYWIALKSGNWSPLMLAIMSFPALLPLVLIKPQFALPVAVPLLTRPRVAACALFLAATLAIDPTWPVRWLAKLGPYGGFVPIVFCPVLALAALRWRDPRARHFTLVASMPQHVYLYDSLLLWTLPRSFREMLILNTTSWVACVTGLTFGFKAWGPVLTTTLIYLPALCLVMFKPSPLGETPGRIPS